MKKKNSNAIDSVGFPQSQILPYVNGDFQLCEKMYAAYLECRLEEFVEDNSFLNQALKNIARYLTSVGDYQERKKTKREK